MVHSLTNGPCARWNAEGVSDLARLPCTHNDAPNIKCSRFFVPLPPCTHLNGHRLLSSATSSYLQLACGLSWVTYMYLCMCAVFGSVIRGFNDVVRRIALVTTDEKDRPTISVIVFDCCELTPQKKQVSPLSERASTRWRI